jgi:hypothetical protein
MGDHNQIDFFQTCGSGIEDGGCLVNVVEVVRACSDDRVFELVGKVPQLVGTSSHQEQLGPSASITPSNVGSDAGSRADDQDSLHGVFLAKACSDDKRRRLRDSGF